MNQNLKRGQEQNTMKIGDEVFIDMFLQSSFSNRNESGSFILDNRIQNYALKWGIEDIRKEKMVDLMRLYHDRK